MEPITSETIAEEPRKTIEGEKDQSIEVFEDRLVVRTPVPARIEERTIRRSELEAEKESNSERNSILESRKVDIDAEIAKNSERSAEIDGLLGYFT